MTGLSRLSVLFAPVALVVLSDVALVGWLSFIAWSALP